MARSSLTWPLLMDGAAGSHRQILKCQQNAPWAAKKSGAHTGGAKGKTRKTKSKFKKKGLSSSGDQVTASHLQGVDSPATQVPWEEWYPNVRSMLLITPMKSISTLSSSQGVNIFMATAVSHGNPSRHQLLNFSEEGTHFPWLPAVPGYTLKNDT